MNVEDFNYDLPEELIAQEPLADRSQSRLMVVNPVAHTMTHTVFPSIVDELVPGDVLVVNNSRVIPARLMGTKPDTGGRIELMLHKRLGELEWEALCRPAKRFRTGTRIEFDAASSAVAVAEQEDGIRRVRFELAEPMDAFLERVGEMPLPHYIKAPLKERDRYQTVYAKDAGSVAAPTAGLHFTEDLLARIRARGVHVVEVTLHVGLGTFRPVQVDVVEAHRMHSEWFEVSKEAADTINRAKSSGHRVIAVGTTAMRTLESATHDGEVQATTDDTSIFIYPGYRFKMVDALITNFHLPKSTLFMLVCAMMGTDFAKQVYEEAVNRRYRFFSFGDAMMIVRRSARDE